MQYKAEIMDEAAVGRSLKRMTHEILERNKGTEGLLLLGIKRRGLPLAREIAENILRFEGAEVPVGYIDITLYRDDLSELTPLPDAGDTCIPVELAGKNCVLVDDVLYTGRTARAAIEGVFIMGGRLPSNWRCWWTGGIGSCRSVPISWARTYPLPKKKWWPSPFRLSITNRTA